jgi:hypothetical protein
MLLPNGLLRRFSISWLETYRIKIIPKTCRVESNKILLFILHKTSKGLIVRDIATGVKECLLATLERISEFYQSASNKTSSQQ